MWQRRAERYLLIVISLFVYGSIVGASPSPRSQNYPLDTLRLALRASHSAIRLDYNSDCESNDADLVPLPKLTLQMLPRNKGGLPAIKELFRNDNNVVVTDNQQGLIRIRIGNPSTRVLETTIAKLRLSPIEQYNPNLIVGAIENSADMRVAMRKLGMRPVVRIFSYALVQPTEGLPHFPNAVTNLSVERLLDKIAITFNEGIIYGACARNHLFDISLTSSFSRKMSPN
jgi:hypothetical protein